MWEATRVRTFIVWGLGKSVGADGTTSRKDWEKRKGGLRKREIEVRGNEIGNPKRG